MQTSIERCTTASAMQREGVLRIQLVFISLIVSFFLQLLCLCLSCIPNACFCLIAASKSFHVHLSFILLKICCLCVFSLDDFVVSLIVFVFSPCCLCAFFSPCVLLTRLPESQRTEKTSNLHNCQGKVMTVRKMKEAARKQAAH